VKSRRALEGAFAEAAAVARRCARLGAGREAGRPAVVGLDDERRLAVRLRLPGAVVAERADGVLAGDAPRLVGLVRLVVFLVGQERAVSVLRVAFARDAERRIAGPGPGNVRVAPRRLRLDEPFRRLRQLGRNLLRRHLLRMGDSRQAGHDREGRGGNENVFRHGRIIDLR